MGHLLAQMSFFVFNIPQSPDCRKYFSVIIRNDGFKVFLSVVEEKLLTHDLVANYAVVGERDARSEAGMLPIKFIFEKSLPVLLSF